MKAVLRFHDWPLRTKLVALLAVALLLPIGFATIFDILDARKRLLATTAALLAARGDQLVRGLDTFHHAYNHSVDKIAKLPIVLEFSQARPEDNVRLEPGVRRTLEIWPSSDPNIRGAAILDLTGTVKVATEGSLIGSDLSFRTHVREALRGIGVISDIYLDDPQTGYEPTIAHLAPVLGANGAPVAVVALWVRATALWDVMKASNELAGPNSFAVLFDRYGIRIGHTYSEDIVFHPGGQIDPALVNTFVAERRFGQRTRQLLEDVRPFPEQFDRSRSESPDQGLFHGFAPVNQKWNYGVARRFQTVPWTVFYMLPEQSINAQIAQMVRRKTMFAVATILITLLAGTLFAAAVLKPVDSLSAATKLIAAGDLAARVQECRADELGQLGSSFNAMAQRIEEQAQALHQSRDELDLRVRERTAELTRTAISLETEVAERKEAEAALRESEQRLRFTLESCNIGAWDMDLVDHTAYRSVEHDRIFGYAEMLPQWTLDDFLRHALPEYRAEVETMVREATAAQRGWTCECPIRRTDGEVRWIWFSGSHRTDLAGHSRVGGIVMDITGRKRAEEAQRASEARYRALFDYAPDGILIADQQSYYLDANPSVCRMLGYTRDEFIGLHASNIVAQTEIPHIGSALRVLTEEKSDYQREWRFRRQDGSVFPAEVIATMMPDGNLMAMIRDVTERKNAEHALHEKERQLHASDRRLAEIVHGMTEACFALDTEWRFTFVNDRGGTLLRHRREQMLGRSIWDVFHKLVGTPMEANYRRAMTERVPVAFEIFSPIAERWLDIRLFPTVEGIAAFLLDIHARKLGEESLRATQARLNSTLSAGSIGTWTWDIVHDRLAADEFTARVFSVEADAAAKGLPAEAYLQAVIEEDRPDVSAALEAAIQSCGHYDIEYRVRQPDGKLLWLQARGRVECDAAGNASNFHGAVMDITERKRVEEELRLRQKHAESLLRLSRKLERALSAADILKASREELQATLGLNVVWLYLRTEDRKFLQLILSDEGSPRPSPVADGELLLIEGDRMLEEIVAADDIVVVEDARTDPRTNKSIVEKLANRTIVNVPISLAGEKLGVIGTGTFHDEGVRKLAEEERKYLTALASNVAAVLDRVMTGMERQRAEEEIQRLNADLERRVAERTVELEAANKELEAFSYSVSHDLRAPLRAVDGFSQAVIEDYGPQLPEEGQRQLNTIREGAQRMGMLIDDLLTFSRLGRAPLNKLNVNTTGLVRSVLHDLKSQAEGRKIDLRIGDLPACAGDPALLKQVWVNLLSNAFKYTQKREAAVVEVGCDVGPEGNVYFVRDNGTGFDMRYADKLFGVFQRLHRAEEYEGTGVGLALVQRIIHRHGGRVWADAALDRGATFFFTLGGDPNL